MVQKQKKVFGRIAMVVAIVCVTMVFVIASARAIVVMMRDDYGFSGYDVVDQMTLQNYFRVYESLGLRFVLE